jgi:hypothetical protein
VVSEGRLGNVRRECLSQAGQARMLCGWRRLLARGDMRHTALSH